MLVKDRKSRGLNSMHAGLLTVGCAVKTLGSYIATCTVELESTALLPTKQGTRYIPRPRSLNLYNSLI